MWVQIPPPTPYRQMTNYIIKQVFNNVKSLRKQLKPNDYYKVLDRLMLLMNFELQNRLKEIEYKPD